MSPTSPIEPQPASRARENGRLAEKWSDKDLLGFLQQLGVTPTPGEVSG
ncbi:hypothetical protein [Embleya sp. NBC_00896]|nr:hypothetical protein OG928_02240 [Embleya sp. NBC_00896]